MSSSLCNVEQPQTAIRHFRMVTIMLAGSMVLLILLIYANIIRELVIDWWTIPSLSQGLLIPPLAGWIAWAMRARIAAQPATSDPRGLAVVAFSCLLLLLGDLAAEFFTARISLVGILVGLTWTFWGLARLRVLTFPFMLLAAMVPLPTLVYNSLAAPLQLLATSVSASVAELAGVSLYTDGNIIYLANITLGVEEACSGLNSLSALLVASLLVGFLFCRKTWCRLVLFVLAIPAAIIANIARVTGTAILADVNSVYAMGFYHTFSGWMVFMIGFAMLYALAKVLASTSEGRS